MYSNSKNVFSQDKSPCNDSIRSQCIMLSGTCLMIYLLLTGDHSKLSILNHPISLTHSLPDILHTTSSCIHDFHKPSHKNNDCLNNFKLNLVTLVSLIGDGSYSRGKGYQLSGYTSQSKIPCKNHLWRTCLGGWTKRVDNFLFGLVDTLTMLENLCSAI